MPRSLADGRTKFTVLTTKPADPAAPTAAELNAGIHLEERILASDFTFGASASEKVDERALAAKNTARSNAAGNYACAFTIWRYFDSATGEADEVADIGFQAVKVKGTEVWVYARKTGKDAIDDWTTGDEIYLGAHVQTDTPQPPTDGGGYIKYRQECEVQNAWDFIEVAAA